MVVSLDKSMICYKIFLGRSINVHFLKVKLASLPDESKK